MTKRCGYVAIVGRPNVGKSTLLNHILGQKLSITSRKPQTTRHNLIGIYTQDESQILFVDTPGLHQGQDKALNRYMNRSATQAYKDVDLILFLLDKDRWTDEDQWIANRLADSSVPVVLVVNKIDQVEDKERLLPSLQKLAQSVRCEHVIPISALRNDNLDMLLKTVTGFLPESDFFYPEDQLTDRSSRFLAAEIVREKITRQLGDELPYQITVEIEEFAFEEQVLHIGALILVEREGQKRILIGAKGERIKQIGQQARQDMETLFDSKVMLTTWVKVKSGWSDDERALRSLGYDDSGYDQ